MLRKILLASVVFMGITFFIPTNIFWKDIGSFNLAWSFNKDLADSSFNAKKYFELIAYEKDGEKFLLKAGFQPLSLGSKADDNFQRYDIPLFGLGYLSYKKLGRDINFISTRGEVLWNKKYSSYPISDYYGKLILLLSGDSSNIEIITSNGFSLDKDQLHGVYLSDYGFATRVSVVLLVFSSGETYLIEETGKTVFKHIFKSETNNIFLKSGVLSPRAKLSAVHLFKDGRDMIFIIEKDNNEKAKIVRRIVLPKIYPHLLHMAINSHGLLIAAPDETSFFALESGDDWSQKTFCTEKCSLYRPVYADENFFAFGFDKTWHFLDSDGVSLFQTTISQELPTPWRFLPAKKPGEFALHSKDYLTFYRYKTR